MLVIDQPGQPTRFVFVHDETGDVLTLRSALDEHGVTVTTADHPPVRFTGGRSIGDGAPTVTRTVGDRSTEVVVGPGQTVFDIDGVVWTVSRPTERRIEVSGPPASGKTVAEHSTGSFDRRSSTYDVWVLDPPEAARAVLQLLVESFSVTRLLSPPVSAV